MWRQYFPRWSLSAAVPYVRSWYTSHVSLTFIFSSKPSSTHYTFSFFSYLMMLRPASSKVAINVDSIDLFRVLTFIHRLHLLKPSQYILLYCCHCVPVQNHAVRGSLYSLLSHTFSEISYYYCIHSILVLLLPYPAHAPIRQSWSKPAQCTSIRAFADTKLLNICIEYNKIKYTEHKTNGDIT